MLATNRIVRYGEAAEGSSGDAEVFEEVCEAVLGCKAGVGEVAGSRSAAVVGV